MSEYGNDPRSLKPAAMTPDQVECYRLLCDLVHGEHHLNGIVRACGRGLGINLQFVTLSTFDFDYLTRLVVMAHDRCIRAEIVPSGPGMIGLHLHKRHWREGPMHSRHPTIDQAVAAIRSGRASA